MAKVSARPGVLESPRIFTLDLGLPLPGQPQNQ